MCDSGADGGPRDFCGYVWVFDTRIVEGGPALLFDQELLRLDSASLQSVRNDPPTGAHIKIEAVSVPRSCEARLDLWSFYQRRP